ncbi:MAG: protein-L-isoaspartate O-methyltransferase [Patescibacteria group bacterium]|nr:protein-L-isoaspartate O-methyltransferase [Patescibacteria group bacterium]
MSKLIEALIEEGWLKTPQIIEAFKAVQRKDFIPKGSEGLAELNEALPIGWDQTISQPLVVALMLEQLQPQSDEKILDIGSGSGWTSALLSEIVGLGGEVIAVEIIPELKDFGEKNLEKYKPREKGTVKFVCADGSKGFSAEAPYDKILCSAEAKTLPQEWKEQLKVGGRIVVPIGNAICVFTKESEEEFKKEEFPGFVFVPLINS